MLVASCLVEAVPLHDKAAGLDVVLLSARIGVPL